MNPFMKFIYYEMIRRQVNGVVLAAARPTRFQYKRLYVDFNEVSEKLRLTKEKESYRHMNQFMNVA